MNNQFGHQLQKQERNYNLLKSNAEELLLRKIESGTITVGSDEWKKRCEVIEYFDTMASRERERYEAND